MIDEQQLYELTLMWDDDENEAYASSRRDVSVTPRRYDDGQLSVTVVGTEAGLRSWLIDEYRIGGYPLDATEVYVLLENATLVVPELNPKLYFSKIEVRWLTSLALIVAVYAVIVTIILAAHLT